MKEITRIHLAQTPFNAELGAKKELENYLAAIEKTLTADDDTLREIEARIIELLAERGVTGEKVITIDDIEQIKKQLGAPAEFVDDQETGKADSDNDKRLMRDREKGMLGGVLAGIGAYTGVDPIWLRLGAIILAFLSFGTAVLVYIVLWIVMPPAKTAVEKLQMAGKPVTLGAIKEQSQTAFAETAEKTKPFVVIVRILLGLGFVCAALGALGLVIFAGTIFGVHMTPDLFSIVDVWLVVAFALAVVSGLLFAILCGLLAYASFAWKFNKQLAVSVVAIIIAGLVAFSGAIGLGAYGGQLTQQNVQNMTRTETIQLNDLAGAKKLVTKNKNTSVEYQVTPGRPYAEMKVVSRDNKTPRWSLERSGETATFSVADTKDPNCENRPWYGSLCIDTVSVVIHGPALESLESSEGQVEYRAVNQPLLDVVTQSNTTVTLTGGVIETVNATVADDSTFDAEGVAVTNASVTVGRNSSVMMGVLSQLTLSTPNSCAAGSQATVSVQRVTYLKEADFVIQQNEIRENCTTITIDEPSMAVIN